MSFILNSNTAVMAENTSVPIANAAAMLIRDIKKSFLPSDTPENHIRLADDASLNEECFRLEVGDKDILVRASDELGFIYGLLYISEKFIGINPFWFWLDNEVTPTAGAAVRSGVYENEKPIVRFRGWFINDEVLIQRWSVNGDSDEPWRMAFEALLRCGGNTVIPGTDRNSRKYRRMAADMGLWITHHHAEPLGAEMFIRAYPDLKPSFDEHRELFIKLWEDAVKEQQGSRTIYTLGFRGQGDYPFWNDDPKYNTPEVRGKLIGDITELQRQIVLKHDPNARFCTNLYGEVMELYDCGLIEFSDDIIKVSADNGYGKMCVRRTGADNSRISSIPKRAAASSGIYYHASFYDLQAAAHIVQLPNSVDFVSRELDAVIEKGMTDYWIINCSNVRPHVYYLDAVRKKWFGRSVTDASHSAEFAKDYYGGSREIAGCLASHAKYMLPYGSEEDEHAGDQFYNENVRMIAVMCVRQSFGFCAGLRWLTDECADLTEQVHIYRDKIAAGIGGLRRYYEKCAAVSKELERGNVKELFDSIVFMQAKLHYFCARGALLFTEGYDLFCGGKYIHAFMKLGEAAEMYDSANAAMRGSEYGVWRGFYYNDCFADIKHTAYMIKKLMGVTRELGDNVRHDLWYRKAYYDIKDRFVMTLLVNDNHPEDWELYTALRDSKFWSLADEE